MMQQHTITMITCWEGQVIAAVTAWLESHLHQSATSVITEAAPEYVLVAGATSARQRLRDLLTPTLADAGEHTIVLVGHAACLDSNAPLPANATATMQQAMAVLQAWFPQCLHMGLWLDETQKIQAISPVMPTTPARHTL